MNLRRICEQELAGQYELQIIDVLENPQLAEDEKILATPTLIKQLPPPLRRVIGDLSDTEKVLLGLEVRTRAADASSSPTSSPTSTSSSDS
jgi:circadian clock protein KaiB